MATFYGTDTYCLTDLPLIDLQVTDPKVLVGQRLGRRLQTPRGALGIIGDDADAGWDVRQYVNGKMGPADLVVAQQQIQAECLKDEEVGACEVTATLAAGVLVVTLFVTLSSGPTFTLVLNVSQVSTSVLFGA